MVSNILCPAIHISGSKNVYSRAEGTIAVPGLSFHFQVRIRQKQKNDPFQMRLSTRQSVHSQSIGPSTGHVISKNMEINTF